MYINYPNLLPNVHTIKNTYNIKNLRTDAYKLRLYKQLIKNSIKKIIYSNNMRGIQARPRTNRYFKFVNTINKYKKREMKIPQKIQQKKFTK